MKYKINKDGVETIIEIEVLTDLTLKVLSETFNFKIERYDRDLEDSWVGLQNVNSKFSFNLKEGLC